MKINQKSERNKKKIKDLQEKIELDIRHIEILKKVRKIL